MDCLSSFVIPISASDTSSQGLRVLRTLGHFVPSLPFLFPQLPYGVLCEGTDRRERERKERGGRRGGGYDGEGRRGRIYLLARKKSPLSKQQKPPFGFSSAYGFEFPLLIMHLTAASTIQPHRHTNIPSSPAPPCTSTSSFVPVPFACQVLCLFLQASR